MDTQTIILIVGVVLAVTVVIGLTVQDLYLLLKVRSFEKKNEELRHENIGLMKHNGKLFDENRKLKSGIDIENIPTFDEW